MVFFYRSHLYPNPKTMAQKSDVRLLTKPYPNEYLRLRPFRPFRKLQMLQQEIQMSLILPLKPEPELQNMMMNTKITTTNIIHIPIPHILPTIHNLPILNLLITHFLKVWIFFIKNSLKLVFISRVSWPSVKKLVKWSKSIPRTFFLDIFYFLRVKF